MVVRRQSLLSVHSHPVCRVAFRRFGAKPQRAPCSAGVLCKRVLRGGSLPRVNPLVDLYIAISLRFAVPVGGENLDAYIGQPCLTRWAISVLSRLPIEWLL